MGKKKQVVASDVTPAAHRVADLVLVRENDQDDRLMMLLMLERTMLGCRDVTGTARALEAGLGPFDDPRAFGAELRRTKKHRMVLFELDGTLFLYAMGSAAALEAGSLDNDYVDFLIEIINLYRPRRIHLEGVTRLLRGSTMAGQLSAALSRSGSVLQAGGGLAIDVTSPSGMMQYQVLVMVSSFERDHIVMRTTAGAVALAARGGCPFAPQDLPPGYVINGGVVRPDPAQVPFVRQLLQVLGQHLTAREKATALSALGLTMRHLAAGRDVAHTRDPKSLIRTLERWLPLYQTGIYVQRRDNPFPGVERIGTAAVVREHDGDAGHIELRFAWGLPDGGWADPEVLAAALDQVHQRKQKCGGQAHRRRKPLLGLARWVDDEHEWLLDSHDKGEYRLRRRIKPTEDDPGGWAEPSVDGADVARVRAADLHRSIAEAIITALEDGVAVQVASGHHIARIGSQVYATLTHAQVTDSLREQARTLREQAARSRQTARAITTEADRRPWIDDAVTLERQANDLDDEIGRRQAQTD